MIRTAKKYIGRLRDPDSITHALYRLYERAAVGGALTLVSMILIVRNVPREDYGLFYVILAVVSIAGLLADPLDESIKRYLQEDIPASHKRRLILFVLLWKMAFAAASIVVFVGLDRLWAMSSIIDIRKDAAYQIYLFLALAIFSVRLFRDTLEATLYSRLLYKTVLRVVLINRLAFLGIVIALMLNGASFYWYLLAELAVMTYVVGHFAKALRSELGALHVAADAPPPPMRVIWSRYIHRYSGPLLVTSALTYAKSQLPVILIGSSATLGEAGNYRILFDIVTRFRKFVTSYLRHINAKFVQKRLADAARFHRILNRWTWLQYGILAGPAVMLIMLSDQVMQILKIPHNEFYMFVWMALIIDFLMTLIFSANKTLIKLRDSTLPILSVSAIRAVVLIVLTAILTMPYGAVGAAASLLISTAAATLATIYFASNEGVLRYQYASFLVVLTAAVGFLISKLHLFH